MSVDSYSAKFGELRIDCTHPFSGDGPCDDCVKKAEFLSSASELVAVRRRPEYPDVLRAFKERFKSHGWWVNRIEGTPLSNDLPVLAAEVFYELSKTKNVNGICFRCGAEFNKGGAGCPQCF